MCHPERSRGILCLRSESRASAGDSSTVFAARNDTRRAAFPCVIPSEVEGSPAYGASLVLRQGIALPTCLAEIFRTCSVDHFIPAELIRAIPHLLGASRASARARAIDARPGVFP